MLIRNKLQFSSPPARPTRSAPDTSRLSSDSTSLTSAQDSTGSRDLGKALFAGASLLIAAPEAAHAAEQVAAKFSDIELVLSSHRAVAQQTDPLLEQKILTPDTTLGNEGGERYHFPEGAMDYFGARHLTADQLPANAPRLTARRVDKNQTSKRYPDGGKFHMLTEPFKECTQFAPDGTCAKAEWNSIRYVNLSCLYENEATGETVRVLHRSTMHNDTSSMDASVCAGHRLVKESKWSMQPYQTDVSGKTLYVNPLHIVEMEVVNP